MLFELENQDVPTRYKFEFNSDLAFFKFAFEPKAAEWLGQQLLNGHPQIKYLQDLLDTSPFASDMQRPWGYGSVLEYTGSYLGWLSCGVILPLAIPALRCKEDRKPDHKRLSDISVSLWLVFDLLNSSACPTRAMSKQMTAFNLCTKPGAASIFATLSPWGTSRLDQLYQNDLDQIEHAMRSAFNRMDPQLNKLERFNVMLQEKGFIYLEVPGDACGLGTGFNQSNNNGRTLTPHNVDSPIQQLSLLAGLATLDSILRTKSRQTP